MIMNPEIYRRLLSLRRDIKRASAKLELASHLVALFLFFSRSSIILSPFLSLVVSPVIRGDVFLIHSLAEYSSEGS